MDFALFRGMPQLGQTGASELMSFPHSMHLTRATAPPVN
jgi:hypothetical protein